MATNITTEEKRNFLLEQKEECRNVLSTLIDIQRYVFATNLSLYEKRKIDNCITELKNETHETLNKIKKEIENI